jgi:hypothetical protein
MEIKHSIQIILFEYILKKCESLYHSGELYLPTKQMMNLLISRKHKILLKKLYFSLQGPYGKFITADALIVSNMKFLIFPVPAPNDDDELSTSQINIKRPLCKHWLEGIGVRLKK